MKIEERENLCKIRSDKKVKILINRTKIATKEILCECEEALETINKVTYAGAYVVTEKINQNPKKFTNRRVKTKSCLKEKTEKEINRLRGEVSILDELIRRVKLKSQILNKMNKKHKIRRLKESLK